MNSRNGPIVLIAEDEAIVRMVLVDAFEDAGFQVLEAGDGEQAVEFLRTRSDIEGVLTDVQMPGPMDGYEVARTAKVHRPNCTVVIASGRQWPTPGDHPEGAEFVRKPYSPEGIVRRFASLHASS
jgi:CheY-like chemotaxis protein